MSKVIKGVNDLESVNPKLAKEWNQRRNGLILPADVAVNSNKKYWWICEKGHEWEANINSRNRGNGCPVCSNRVIVEGFNDLLSQNPQLAEEWNYEKNTEDSPKTICYKSNKRVWWRCRDCQNEWMTSVYDRYKGTGCPFCSGRRCIKGINDLATTHPKLVGEWDYDKNGDMTPENVSAGSSRKVWWKCKYGHEYRTIINLRALHGTGCPTCSKNLKTSFPEQALYYYTKKCFPDAINGYKELGRELDVFIPKLRTAIEYDGRVWHNLKSSIKNDTSKNALCKENSIYLIRIREEGAVELPYDSNCKVYHCKANDNKSLAIVIHNVLNSLGVTVEIDIDRDRDVILEQYLTAYRNNSLLIKYPELAKEWNQKKNGNITPDMVNAKTPRKYWWLCERGHEWLISPAQRVNAGSGCPYCSGHRVIKGETDLITVNPDLASEWDYNKNEKLSPSDIKPFSNRKIWWLGKCGHEWQASPSDRMNGNGCPFCSGQRVLKGFNDFESNFPDLSKEWNYERNDGIKPSDITTHSTRRKYWWKCKYGHEWESTPADRAEGGVCPYCSGKKAIPGKTDLLTVCPNLASEWNYEKNKEIYPVTLLPHSNLKVWWKCKDGHEWEASVANRNRGAGCPYCTGRFSIIGKNDLTTVHPEIAKYWDIKKNEKTPKEYSSSSGIYVWWICEKGHSWKNRIQLQVRAKGCPYCMNKKVLAGFNDLVTTHPDLSKEWHPTKNGTLTPEMVLFCNNKKVWWKGTCGHEWEAAIMCRTNKNHPTGCPYCAGKKVLKGFNDLETLFPDVASEWDYEKNSLLPSDYTYGSAKKVFWKCERGHEWEATICSRTKKKANRICPVCRNNI